MRNFPAGYYTGESQTWEIAGALLTEVRHRSGKSVPEHQHAAPYFSLLLEGAYEERGDGFDLRYEPYTLVFHSAGTTHADRMLGACRFFAVDLLPRWQAVIAELGGAAAHVFELTGGDPIWLVLRLYREFLRRADAAESTVEALIYELCAHVAKRADDEFGEPPWLSKADAAVRDGFCDPLDLASLAAAIGVHPTHLCRAFRRFRGHTISDAIVGARVQYVARRLVDLDESLADIAVEAGFTDQSHMTRTFKRTTGHPPGEHRLQVTGRPESSLKEGRPIL
ncbi:MAG: helix-turn-helix transcriptional regulator [Candidatus Eremiobacteraeota bacterium]|nr:helix-turn-helix transcriptional regulator [Candidatus Eremiobacteraeota bacterium]